MLQRLILGAAFAVGLAGAASANEVRIAVAAEPYPPFASQNAAGEWEGFEVDLYKAVCKAAELNCVLTPTAWDGIIPALTANRIDVIWASMSITEERKQTIDFSIPYYTTPAAWMGPKGSTLALTPEGLAGKVIAVQTGTIHANFAQKYYGATSTVNVYNTQDEANLDIASGRADIGLADISAFEAFIATDGGKDLAILGNAPADPIFGAGVGAGLRKGDPLIEKINAGIRAVYASGEFNTIQQKYFKYDVGTPPKS
jgi:polar amino acid transport system substrate-binding protein